MSIQSLSGQSCTGTFNLRNLLVDYCDELTLSSLMGEIYNFTMVIEHDQGLKYVNQFSVAEVPGSKDRINVIVMQGGNQLGFVTLKEQGGVVILVGCVQTPPVTT